MLRQLARISVLVLASGLACAFLVRYAPGTMVDERELDRRLSEESIRELRANKADIFGNFKRYLVGLTRGDLGYSESNNAPIAALIADRAPETLREIGIGLLGGWIIGLALALRRTWAVSAGMGRNGDKELRPQNGHRVGNQVFPQQAPRRATGCMFWPKRRWACWDWA